jgi:hypothetical protein
MTSRTISQLSPTPEPAGDEAIPFARGGANGRITPGQIAALTARRTQARPLRIAFAGDSIGLLTGGMRAESPWFWSQARYPRRWDFVGIGDAGGLVAVSGSRSGTLMGGTGAVSYTAIDGADMNTPAMIARLTAWQPDVLVIEGGTNDGSYNPDGTSTFRNTRAFLEAVGARHTIIMPILPQGGDAGGATFRQDYNALIREYERTTPGIHVLHAAEAHMADAVRGVAGGNTGAGGAMTVEGLHPSVHFGLALEPAFTALLDAIGAPRIAPRAIVPATRYAAGHPGLNVIGAPGDMAGEWSGQFVSAPCTGEVPKESWGLNTEGEMIAAASRSIIEVGGASYDAIKLALSASAPLTADRLVTLAMNFTIPAGPFHPGEAQAVIRVRNPVGLAGVSFGITGSVGGVPFQTVNMGLARSGAYDANIWPSDMDEVLSYMLPGSLPFEAGVATVRIMIQGRAGQTPSGEITVGQVGYHLQTGLPA